MKTLVKGCLIVIAIWFISGCSEEALPPLKIGSNIWSGYELYYLARNIGALDEQQARLVEFANATDVSHQLVNGNIQAGLLTLDEAIRLEQSGLPLKVVHIVDFSRGGDVVMGRKALEEGESLIGKTIAVEGSAVGALMLTSFSKHIDVSIDHLNVQYIRVDDSEKAFNEGADFVVTFEPFRTKLLNLGAVQVFDSSFVPNLIVDVFVVREDAINAGSRQQIQHAVNGYYKAKRYFENNNAEAAKLMAKRLRITPEEVISSYDGIALASEQDNERMLSGEAPDILDSIQAINDILLSINLISDSVTPTELILTDPILAEPITN